TPDTPELTECTQKEITRCYTEYVEIFYSYAPQHGSENTLSEDAYTKVCSAFNETSSCYAGFDRCPDSVKANFTRREEGYRALRALACDKEAYKGVTTVRLCPDPRKMRECMEEEHGEFEFDRDYEKLFCRYGPTQKMCFEKTLNSSCPLSVESRQTAITKIMAAAELIHDCERMYQRAPKVHRSNITAGDPAALEKLGAEVAEMQNLQRKALQTLYTLLEKVESMDRAGKRERIEDAKIVHQQMKSIEALEGVVQGLQKDIAQRCKSDSESPDEKSRGLF
ncbi:hypothetical protein V5799_030784, partial [Amblyomma americanum]